MPNAVHRAVSGQILSLPKFCNATENAIRLRLVCKRSLQTKHLSNLEDFLAENLSPTRNVFTTGADFA